MKSTFRFKILLLMISTILIPVVFLTIFITSNSDIYQEKFVKEAEEANLTKDVSQIEQFYINSENALTLYSNMIGISTNKEYIYKILDDFKLNNESVTYAYYSSEDGFNGINGRVTPEVEGFTRDWYITAKTNNAFTITAPYTDVLTGKSVITLSVPVYDHSGFIGVMGVDYELSKILTDISGKTRLKNSIYIVKDLDNNIIYYNDEIDTIEEAEQRLIQADTLGKTNVKHYLLSALKMNLFILYDSDNYAVNINKIRIQMTFLFVFVIFITVIFAFAIAKRLNGPLQDFKNKIKNSDYVKTEEFIASGLEDWDEEFYLLFSKFDQLSKRIELDRLKLSKRVQLFQNQNSALMEKNMDLEEQYKNLKSIEKKVKKSKIEYESILENIKGMIWVSDGVGNIVYTNETLMSELGYDADELEHQNLRKIIENNYSDKFSFFEMISNRNYKKIELNLLSKEGKKISVEANTSRVLNDKGEILYIYGICRKTREVKELHYNYNVKIQEQNLIMDLTETASMKVSMQQVTKAIFEKINSIFGWSVGTIRFLNDNNEFELIARTDVGSDYIVGQALSYEDSCLTYVIEKNEILYINHIEELPIKEEIYCQIIEDGYSLIFIPVGNPEIGKGVISLTIDRLSMVEKEDILKSFTNTILIVVERALIYEKLKKDYIRMIKVLAEAGDDKDSSSVGHSNRVSYYSKKIGENLFLDDDEIIEIEICGLLHDIGKIGISDQYLTDQTDLGKEKVKLHPIIGRKMLEDIGLAEQILDGIEMHHMNFDLSGYPQLEDVNTLPLFPRIIQVADEFDNCKVSGNFKSDKEIYDYMNRLTNEFYCPQIMKVLRDLIEGETF